jgi:osmotically-inducible protein OsmY
MNTRTPFLLVLAAAASLALGGCSQPPEPAAVAEAEPQVRDLDVTTNVKTALLREETLRPFDIGVTTLKGDVRLSGMVDTPEQIATANRLARAAEGAHSIHDELTLKQ